MFASGVASYLLVVCYWLFVVLYFVVCWLAVVVVCWLVVVVGGVCWLVVVVGLFAVFVGWLLWSSSSSLLAGVVVVVVAVMHCGKLFYTEFLSTPIK